MSETLNQTGRFIWYEYMGNDLKAAVDFYTSVVGWSAKDAGMDFGFAYELLSAGSTMVGGVMDIPADAKAMGARPGWLGYIWLDDLDQALPKLTAAGGKVLRAPADVPGVGRFAVAADPDGAVFMPFQGAGSPPPPPPPRTPGLIGWRELHAGDGAKALAFYSGLFGWKKERDFDMGAMGAYHIFDDGRGQQGGIVTKRPDMPAPFWLYYFNVDAIDPAAERVTAKGGRVVNGPMQVPGGQWIVQGLDPQDALFALVASER